MLRKTRKLNLSWQNNQFFYQNFAIFRGLGLTIYHRPLLEGEKSRISVVVGKKNSRSAVVRNKLKRKLYFLVEKLQLLLLLKDIVIVANKTNSTNSYDQILTKFFETYKT